MARPVPDVAGSCTHPSFPCVPQDTSAEPYHSVKLMKLLSLDEAVSRFVADGASVAMGMALESLIPFAAGHAVIRQQRRDLELIGPISDMLFDQLIGAGCVRRITAAWVGNVSAGLGHNYRRAVEQGLPNRLELEEHSNFSVGLGLLHVLAIEPDVAILHVQRADAEGHAHCWGNLGITREAGLAARHVILVAEEVVPSEVILSDPNR